MVFTLSISQNLMTIHLMLLKPVMTGNIQFHTQSKSTALVNVVLELFIAVDAGNIEISS